MHQPEDTNLLKNQMIHLLISISTQTIGLISSRHSQIALPDASFYSNILSASGCKENLTNQKDLPPLNRVRKKIKWFNPPYSMNVETNIGKTFLKRLVSISQKLTVS